MREGKWKGRGNEEEKVDTTGVKEEKGRLAAGKSGGMKGISKGPQRSLESQLEGLGFRFPLVAVCGSCGGKRTEPLGRG